MAKQKGKKEKYAKELARLRELSAINEILKKGDIENAALTNTSKDSETVNDNAIDTMLDQLNINKNASKDLEIMGGLTRGERQQTARRAAPKAKPKKRARTPKRSKPKPAKKKSKPKKKR